MAGDGIAQRAISMADAGRVLGFERAASIRRLAMAAKMAPSERRRQP
jgi:hypothetical protein